MKDNRKYCVYRYTSPSGKFYIGLTGRTLDQRAGENGIRYAGCPFFWCAIEKYGFENFKREILFDNLTKEEAEQKEIEMIAKYKSNQKEFGYNVAIGGESNVGFRHTKEWKEKLRVLNSGEGNPFYGKKHTIETKKKMSDAAKNRSQEHRNKLRNAKSKKVYQIDIITNVILAVYPSVKEATKITGITHISEVCLGKIKSAGGYKWTYEH